MHTTARVSIVVIFLNAEKFIHEAIESVFAQTYESWELLLVDDGSTDSSTVIAQRFAEQHPGQVYYLEHENHANCDKNASRNLGISAARGEYIAFLDADDVWLPHKLAEQVAILDSQPEAGMLYGRDQYWYSWTENPNDRPRDFVNKLGIPANRLIQPPTLLPLFLRHRAAIPCPTNILMRRAVIEQVGGFEETFQGLYDDQVFYAKVCLKIPVFVSDACWDKYRQHANSSCAVALKSGQEYIARQFFLNWLVGYMLEQGFTDPEVWQALQSELWLYRHPTWLPLPEHTRNFVRWTKKWLLRLEEWSIPPFIRDWLGLHRFNFKSNQYD